MRTITYNGYSFLVDETGFGRYWLDMEQGKWEPWTFRMFDKLLKRDVTYIDLGAWIGMTVLYASKLCDKCYAFEPDPSAYEVLCRNIAANKVENVKAFNEAVFTHDGTLSVGNEYAQMGNAVTRVGETRNAIQVPCVTLDHLVEREGISGPIFIKMDVEGAEEYILEQTGFFERHKPILYISVHDFWFKDREKGMETIKKVGRMYKKHLQCDMWKIDIEKDQGSYLFMD